MKNNQACVRNTEFPGPVRKDNLGAYSGLVSCPRSWAWGYQCCSARHGDVRWRKKVFCLLTICFILVGRKGEAPLVLARRWENFQPLSNILSDFLIISLFC